MNDPTAGIHGAREEIGLPRERTFFPDPPPRPADPGQIRALYRGELPDEAAREVRELTLCYREWAEADADVLAVTARERLSAWGEVAELDEEDVLAALRASVEAAAGDEHENRALVDGALERLVSAPVGDPDAEAWLLETLVRGMERLLDEEARRRIAEGPGREGEQETARAAATTLAAARSRPQVISARLRAIADLDAIDPRQALVYRLHVFGGRTVPEIGRVLRMDEPAVQEELDVALVEVSVTEAE